MAQDIDDLLYKIEQEISNGKKPLFGSGVIVDGELIFELIDRVRSALPESIREARFVIAASEKRKQEDMLKAQKILESAEQRRNEMLSESNITYLAEQEAKAIREQANEYCGRLYSEVKNDLVTLFENAEKTLSKALDQIVDAKDRLI